MEAEVVFSIKRFYVPKLPQSWCVAGREPGFSQLCFWPASRASGYGEVTTSE